MFAVVIRMTASSGVANHPTPVARWTFGENVPPDQERLPRLAAGPDDVHAVAMNFFNSAGFGGVCALAAALIAFAAAQFSTRQRRQTDRATLAGAAASHADQRREEEIQRCWDRYVWLVDHIDEVGIPLAAGLLARITETAVRLEDRDLVEFSRQLAAELLETVAGPPIIAPSAPARPTREGHTGDSDEEGDLDDRG